MDELKPGHYLVYNRCGLRINRYGRLESNFHEDDLDTTAGRVGELFMDTVTRQLVADVSVCTLLSGGLDSSAITAAAAGVIRQAGGGSLHTWSLDFEDNDRYFVPDLFQPNDV